MPREIARRSKLDGPRGDAVHGRLPELRRRHVVIERAGTIVTTGATVWVKMQPGTGGNRKCFGSSPNRQNTIGDLVDQRIVAEPAANTLVRIDRQYVRASGQCQRIAADAGAEIDDQRAGKSPRFMPRDRLRGRLFDRRGLDPHLLAALEFVGGLNSCLHEANRRQETCAGDAVSSKSGEVGRSERLNRGHLGQQPLTGSVIKTHASASMLASRAGIVSLRGTCWTRVHAGLGLQ